MATATPQVQPCRYKTGKTLGAGSYSVVKECVHIDTGRYYAAKVINKRLMMGREHMVRNEIAVLKRVSMGHQNILTLVDYFETMNNCLCPRHDCSHLFADCGSVPCHGPGIGRGIVRPHLQKRFILRVGRSRSCQSDTIRGSIPSRPWHCPQRFEAGEPSLPYTGRQCRLADCRLWTFSNHGRRAISRPDDDVWNTWLYGARDLQEDWAR